MDSGFINNLSIALSNNLPGIFAQQEMAPSSRFIGKGFPEQSSNAIKSAVLILIYPDSDFFGTVFIERNKYPGAHSGQISFPGGKFETTDFDLKTTAIREAKEEIGLDSTHLVVLGSLTNLYIPISNFVIYPFVVYIGKKPIFKPDPKEVNSIIEINLYNLYNTSNRKSKIITTAGHKINAPFYDANGYHVWGATAMILSELHEILKQAGFSIKV